MFGYIMFGRVGGEEEKGWKPNTSSTVNWSCINSHVAVYRSFRRDSQVVTPVTGKSKRSRSSQQPTTTTPNQKREKSNSVVCGMDLMHRPWHNRLLQVDRVRDNYG